jgi:hypothetical protein
MTKRIIIHIGTHKTGTTSIQKALFLGRESLSKVGVLYPATDLDRGTRQRLRKQGEMSAVARRGRPRAVERERSALTKEFEASGAHTMVISEEGLSGPNPNCVEFFRPLAAQYQLEVVCYLRRQDLFVESFFNQVIKRAERNLAHNIIDYMNTERTRARLDYHRMLSTWRALPAQVTALDFATEARSGGLVASFLRAASIDSVNLPEELANTSPDMRVILAMMDMNRLDIPFEDKRVLRAGTRASADLKPLKLLLGGEARRQLLLDCAASNALLARDFGVAFDARLPDEPAQPVLAADPDYLLRLVGEMTRLNESADTPLPV